MARNPHSLSAIDLFSGAGGMAEGFRRAGFETLLATDSDEMAGRTFKFNHPEVPFLQEDIHNLTSDLILDLAGIERTNLGVICGGPPCQGFSLAGRRLANDSRNDLFHQFVRIVNGVQPRFFVFENVTGILSLKGGLILEAILREFEAIGYSCTYKVLNAADYGVPQARPRFILVGSRDGETFSFPKPTHFARSASGLFDDLESQLRHVTAWEALSDLPEIEQGEGLEEVAHEGSRFNDYQKARRGHRQPGTLFNHRATAHSSLIQARYAAIPEGGDASTVPTALRTKKTNFYKLDRSRPSRTVTCNHRTDIIHPVIPRGTTVREAARLQSFDDDYCFFGNLTRKAKWVTQDDQVGNAVPPLLAEALASEIKKSLSLHREISNAA